MRQIRDNIWFLTHEDLGRTIDQGEVKVEGLGIVNLDAGDEYYIREYLKMGLEPAFFVSQSEAMRGWFVVVSRQRTSLVNGIPSGERV